MNCKETRDHLPAYLDDALDKDTGGLVERHLQECAACAEELAALKACLEKVRALPKQQAPADFLQGVHQRIEKDATRGTFLSLPKLKLPLELAGLAATLLFLVLFSDIVKETRQASYTALLSPRSAVRMTNTGKAAAGMGQKSKEEANTQKAPAVAQAAPLKAPAPATCVPKAAIVRGSKAKAGPLNEPAVEQPSPRKAVTPAICIPPRNEAVSNVRHYPEEGFAVPAEEYKNDSCKAPVPSASRAISAEAASAAPGAELRSYGAFQRNCSTAKINGAVPLKMTKRSASDALDTASLPPLYLTINGKVTDTTLSRLSSLVERLQGKTLSSGHTEMKIRLPAERYPEFLKELKDLGTLRETPTATGQNYLSLTILIIENTSR